MSKLSLLRQLNKGKWMIEPRYAESLKPSVLQVINGEKSAFFDEIDEMNEKAEQEAGYLLALENDVFSKVSTEEIPENSLAVFKLSGPVMKETVCGMVGTATLRSQIAEAMAHPNINALIFITDTGGGAVDGTFELADELYALDKPVIGYVDGMSCSAGYALMAGCDAIYASHKTAEVGSIGVCLSIVNRDEAKKSIGITEHYYNATTSPDKNQGFLKAKDGDGSLIQKSLLDPTHAIFKETVFRTRENVAEEALTGSVYMAEEAQKLGLIDGIATMEDLVNEAYEKGINYKNQKNI